MTGLLAHGVWLALVLGHASVDLPVDIPSVSALIAISFVSGLVLDNVRSDRGLEDIGEGEGVLGGSTIGAVDGNGRSGGHCDGVVLWLVEADGGCLLPNLKSRKLRGLRFPSQWELSHVGLACQVFRAAPLSASGFSHPLTPSPPTCNTIDTIKSHVTVQSTREAHCTHEKEAQIAPPVDRT